MSKSRVDPALALVLAIGAATGLYGLDWGLPGPQRLRAFPEGMTMTPAVAKQFSDAWAQLYQSIERSHENLGEEEPVTYVTGVDTVPHGWSFPPPSLLNSYRSLLLQSENPDEKKSFIILGRMRPWRLNFEPLYIFYGGAFIYPLGAFLAAASATGAVTLVSSMDHYLMHPGDMGGLYLAGRVFIVLFHLGTLWILFDIGRRISGRYAGFLGALIFAVTPVVAVNTHMLKPHLYAAFWLFGALRYALLTRASGSRREYLLMGACCGMAMGASFTFALFFVIPVLVWIDRRRSRAAVPREERLVAASLAAAAAIFVVTNPYFAASPLSFAWDLTIYQPEKSSWSFLSLVSLGKGWVDALGPLTVACAAAGFFAALRRGGEARSLAMILAVLFALLWALFGRFYSFGLSGTGIRYYYPLLGLSCVLAGDVLARLHGRRPLLAALILAAALLDSGVRFAVYLENMRLGAGPASTRMQAADWIDANLTAGSTLGLSHYPEPWRTPPFRYDRFTLMIFDRPQRLSPRRLPEHIVVGEESRAAIEAWGGDTYELAKSFLPVSLAWARPSDTAFFANTGVHIFRRKSAPPLR